MDRVCRDFKYYCALLGMIFIPCFSFAQSFTTFFSDFVRYPDVQYQNVRFPLPTENGVLKSKNNYIPLRLTNKQIVPIVCVDSLNSVSIKKEVQVSVVNILKNTSATYSFERSATGWRLMTQNKGIACDDGFVDFLKAYSQDEAFQKKRTIFPFPYRKCKNRDCKGEAKLLMPREWEIFDFTTLYPTICLFCSSDNSSVSNRRLIVLKNNEPSILFNFIRINNKWYLIEIEEYI